MRHIWSVMVAGLLIAAGAFPSASAQSSEYLQGYWSYAADPNSVAEDAVVLMIDVREAGQVSARLSFLGIRCVLSEVPARGRDDGGNLALQVEPQGRCPAGSLLLQRSIDGTYQGTLKFATLATPIIVALRPTPAPEVPLARQWRDDTARTWAGADVFIPGSLFPVRPAAVPLSAPMPVVIFMHGCGGFNASDRQLMPWLNARGYVVVAPDSFKRVDRPYGCNSKDHAYGPNFLKLVSYRLEEVDAALDQLATVPWADTGRIFLVGHSEGGNTASRVSVSGLRGIVISGDRCGAGILAPAKTPVLVVRFSKDPWYSADNRCPAAAAARSNGLYVELPGEGHWPYQNPAALNALDDFLSRNSAK